MFRTSTNQRQQRRQDAIEATCALAGRLMDLSNELRDDVDCEPWVDFYRAEAQSLADLALLAVVLP